MKKRIFLTGGTGFAGGQFLIRCKEKYDIVAMAREEKDIAKLREKGANSVIVVDDLVNLKMEDFNNIDVVVHFAAIATTFAKKEEFYHVNVEGTKKIVDEAKKARVSTFVQISTESVLFTGQELVNVTENMPYPKKHKYDYSETKAIAEKYVLDANSENFRTVALRPSMIWGPGDYKFIPSVIESVKNGKFMLIDHGLKQKSTTHVNNLIFGIELAIQNGKGGNTYFINDGEKNSLKYFLELILKEKGLELPNKSMSSKLALMLAFVFEGIYKITKKDTKPPITEMEVRFFMNEITLSIEKAKKELNYAPIISVIDGVKTIK